FHRLYDTSEDIDAFLLRSSFSESSYGCTHAPTHAPTHGPTHGSIDACTATMCSTMCRVYDDGSTSIDMS
ncbi:hypothetical protein QZH41_008588, partial [Actinostola sp. cb2023]